MSGNGQALLDLLFQPAHLPLHRIERGPQIQELLPLDRDSLPLLQGHPATLSIARLSVPVQCLPVFAPKRLKLLPSYKAK